MPSTVPSGCDTRRCGPKPAYHGSGPPLPEDDGPKENPPVDVRIGVTHTPKEIEVELADGTNPDALVQHIEQALSGQSVLWLTDRRGRRVGIPAATVAYIELNTASEDRR